MRECLNELVLIQRIRLVRQVVSVGEAPRDQPSCLIYRQRLRDLELQPKPWCEIPQQQVVKSDQHPEVALQIALVALRNAVMYGLDIQLTRFH